MYQRIFVIVLDSLGVGAMPDSKEYGDIGVDTWNGKFTFDSGG